MGFSKVSCLASMCDCDLNLILLDYYYNKEQRTNMRAKWAKKRMRRRQRKRRKMRK